MKQPKGTRYVMIGLAKKKTHNSRENIAYIHLLLLHPALQNIVIRHNNDKTKKIGFPFDKVHGCIAWEGTVGCLKCCFIMRKLQFYNNVYTYEICENGYW